MERPKESIDIDNFKVATKELPDKLKIYVKTNGKTLAINDIAKVLSKNKDEEPCIVLLVSE